MAVAAKKSRRSGMERKYGESGVCRGLFDTEKVDWLVVGQSDFQGVVEDIHALNTFAHTLGQGLQRLALRIGSFLQEYDSSLGRRRPSAMCRWLV